MNQHFDAQDQRLDRLTDNVSKLHKLTIGISKRVSRNLTPESNPGQALNLRLTA